MKKTKKTKNAAVWVWTELIERVSNGRKKAGQEASFNGGPLEDGEITRGWEQRGYIERRCSDERPERP